VSHQGQICLFCKLVLCCSEPTILVAYLQINFWQLLLKPEQLRRELSMIRPDQIHSCTYIALFTLGLPVKNCKFVHLLH